MPPCLPPKVHIFSGKYLNLSANALARYESLIFSDIYIQPRATFWTGLHWPAPVEVPPSSHDRTGLFNKFAALARSRRLLLVQHAASCLTDKCHSTLDFYVIRDGGRECSAFTT